MAGPSVGWLNAATKAGMHGPPPILGFLAILFAVIALSRLPAATFGTIAYLEPVAVVIFGWTIFHETLSPLQIGGCLVIILSGIAKSMAGQTESKQQEELHGPVATAIGTEE